MELKFALLADLASETKEGKLNIMGEFDSVWTTGKPPIVWPMCFLVARFEARVTEGTNHTFQLAISHMNGTVVIPRQDEVTLPFVTTHPRQRLRAQVVARLGPLQFPELGKYEIKIWVDREFKAAVPIHVKRIEQIQR